MARRRVKINVADTVELTCAWLADKGIIACILFRDEAGWNLAGTNFPALPDVLRAVADEAEEMIGDKPIN